MAHAKLINSKNNNEYNFIQGKLQNQQREILFSEILFEKDCAMSSLDYLVFEDNKLDEQLENEKMKMIGTNIFLVSSNSDIENESTYYN